MGGQTYLISPNKVRRVERMKTLIAKIEEQNVQLRNANDLKSHELRVKNQLSDIIGTAGFNGQSNISQFTEIFNNNIYSPLTLNYTALMYAYMTHGLLQTALNVPILDALRGGVTIDPSASDLDESDIAEFDDFMEEEGVLDNGVSEMSFWNSLFGGAALVVNTGANPAEPLTDDDPLDYLRFYPASRWELGAPYRLAQSARIVTAESPWEREGASYLEDYYLFYNQRIHRSRIIPMTGPAAPWMIRWILQGWGMSDLERVIEDFNLFLRGRNAIFDLLNEAKVDVFQVAGMAQALSTPEGTTPIQNRINAVQQMKNFNNAILLDELDKYDQKQLAFSGLSEMMSEIRIMLAAAFRMPMTKLWGVSPAGFSSGEDSIENYNARIESEIRQKLRPVLRKVFNLIHRYLWGKEFVYKFDFKPLRVLSAKDEEEIKDRKFNRVTALFDRGLMDSEEVGKDVETEALVNVELKASQGLIEPFPARPGAPPEPFPIGGPKP
jgi:uncharacterized protein